MTARDLCTVVIASLAAASPAWSQGHGPLYGLSTPTLGKGGWSLDLGTMARVVGPSGMIMLRPMLSYGLTEDLQVSASFPMPVYTQQGLRPTHGMSRMPTNPDVEFLLGWRFHRSGVGVGARFETTAYVGFDYPTDAIRAGARMSPGLYGALVTGYASRALYAWAGGLYRRYMTPVGSTADHPGDVAMYSVVLGYRPPPFQRDFPHPDWRVFVEAFGEYTARDVVAGFEQPDTGGHQIFVGPTLLGLYGAWGISGGPVFPVFQRLNGAQPREALRLGLITTFWF
ncbi:MAG TPA: hypothetical protein VNL18_09750 [Gemmatimonadales bacterium]|nr:hypothetical protein [Gemmatimonadales bacterium]